MTSLDLASQSHRSRFAVASQSLRFRPLADEDVAMMSFPAQTHLYKWDESLPGPDLGCPSALIWPHGAHDLS